MTINKRLQQYTEIPPNRQDPVNYSPRADYLAAYIPPLASDIGVMADEFNATAEAVNNLEQSSRASKEAAELAAQIANSSANIKGEFQAGVTNALQGETWIYEGAFWYALVNTSSTPAESSADWVSLSKHNSTTGRDKEGAHPASAIDGIERGLEQLLGVNARIWPKTGDLVAGDAIPAPEGTEDGLPITHLAFKGNVYAMSPISSGVVAISSGGLTVGGVNVSLERVTEYTNTLTNDRTSKIISGNYESNGFTLAADQSIEGQGRLSTTIEAENNSVVSASGVESTTDTRLSRVTIRGGGKNSENTVGYDLFAPDMSFLQHLRNELSHVAIRDADIGIHTNTGWHNTFACYRVTDCNVGWKNEEASWLGSWGGSGQISQGAYFAACNTGIDTTAMWNSTFINTVVEYCGTPIYERGNSNTYINTWLEGNALPIKIMRGSVFINGRGLNFDLSEITNSIPQETLTLITNRGISVARRNLDKPEFLVDGDGVKDFRTPISGGRSSHYRTAFSGSGDRIAHESVTYTGATSTQAFSETVPIAAVQQRTSADGSNNLFGAITLLAGKASSGGTPDEDHPYEEKWRVRFDGELRPGKDAYCTIGSGGRRVNTIHLVNAPSVTSDERLKTELMDVTEAERRVAHKIKIKSFKYTEAIERKGVECARLHFGVGAQSVIEAFESEGLSAFDYALIRRVEWDSVLDDEGGVLVCAGWRYEVVYEELLAFKLACLC